MASSTPRRADQTAEAAGAGLLGGLRNPCGMQSRLTSLLTWATDSSACFCVICSPGGCASGHVTCTFVASQHHSHGTVKSWNDYVSGNVMGHCASAYIVSAYTWVEWLPRVGGFLVHYSVKDFASG